MRRLFLLGAFCFCFEGGSAVAQSNPTSAPTSSPTSAPTTVPSSLQEAIDLFSAGEFAKAARLFEAAQSAGVRDPIVWYYLGRCREATNDISKAMRAYQQYLKLAPNAPDAPAVRLHLAELEAQNPQSGNPQPSTQADTEDPEIPKDETLLYSSQARLGYASIALGSMTSLVGLMLGVVAKDRRQLLESVPVGTPFDETFQEIEQQGKTFNKASIITASIGGALFFGGLTAALTAPKTAKKDQPQIEVRSWFVPSSSPMVGLTGSW